MFVLLLLCSSVLAITNCREVETSGNISSTASTPRNMQHEKIEVYYECLCPHSRKFYIHSLVPVYKKLVDYLDVLTYPFGKAQIFINYDGIVASSCQHGDKECYGDTLHACAIDILSNTTSSIYFNSCLMEELPDGSDDATADKCGKKLNVDAGPIKECAKSKRGLDLFLNYGDESRKVGYKFVPYVLINGVKWDPDVDPDFTKRVCQEFKQPPSPCAE